MAELSDILNTVGTFIQQSKAEASVIQENTKKAEQASVDVQKTLEIVAKDAALITTVQKTAELSAQGQILKISNAAAGDSAGIADRITSLMTKVYTSQEEVSKNLKEVRRQRETTPLTPVDWIVAQVTLPFAEDRLKGAVDETKTYLGQVQDINATLQPAFQTIKQVQETVTVASIEAGARIAAAEATIKAKQAAIEGFKYNSAGVAAANDATKEQLAMLFQAKNAVNAEKQMGISLAHLALDKERFSWQKQEKAIADAARKEGKQVDDVLMEKVNLSRAAFGLPQITGPEAKSSITMLKSGASKDLAYHYENGDRIKATGKGFIGASPAESIEALKNIPANLGSAMQETTKLLQDAESALQASKTIDKKDKDAVKGFLNAHVKQQIAADYSQIRPNSGNILDAGDLRSYLTLSAVSDLGITKKLLDPIAKTGVAFSDPKVVISLGVKGVADGTITSAEFQDLATVYRKASLITQQARDFTGFGIALPDNGKKYNVKIDGMGIVDVADPVVLGRILSRQLAYRQNLNRKSTVKPFVATGEDQPTLTQEDLSFGGKLYYPPKQDKNIYKP